MNPKRISYREILLLFLIAFILLTFSLISPFISIQFDPEIPAVIEKAKDLVYSGSKTPIAGNFLQQFVNQFFGTELFSAECRPKWNDCFRDWLAAKAGFQVGKQYLVQMIATTFSQGDILLGILILSFSVFFPIFKIGLGILISLDRLPKLIKQRWYKILVAVGKWSMTDVFVVALLIMFFKAEHVHLVFHAEIGVYCFALSTIFASLASMLLGKAIGAKLVFE